MSAAGRRGWIAALPVLAAVFLVPPTPAAPASGSVDVRFREIDRGESSNFRYGDPDFTGAEWLITNRRAWKAFWVLHTRGISPTPPLPEVGFPEENVIVVLLGTQASGGGPSIGVGGITRGDGITRVEVLEDRKGGPLTVITNPYQIVVTSSLGKSITFLHVEPGDRLCLGHQDCPADHVCSRVDPTCRSDVTGRCLYRPPGTACPQVEMPVCGCDGITYTNACVLELEGAVLRHEGACR